jgi:hypothetical protein
MKFIIIWFLISIYGTARADALLDAIYSSFNEEVYEKNYETAETDRESSDAEVYHWDLGTPDNIPETVIIYTQSSSCGCY